jgi:hypothetical protein
VGDNEHAQLQAEAEEDKAVLVLRVLGIIDQQRVLIGEDGLCLFE